MLFPALLLLSRQMFARGNNGARDCKATGEGGEGDDEWRGVIKRVGDCARGGREWEEKGPEAPKREEWQRKVRVAENVFAR